MLYNAKDFNYNIEMLLADYHNYVKESKTYKMEDREKNFCTQMRAQKWQSDSVADEKSNNHNESKPILTNDEEYQRALYGEINEAIMKYAQGEVDLYFYEGGPIYDNEGITRELLGQITDKVLDKVGNSMDSAAEVLLRYNERGYYIPWSDRALLYAAAEAVILNEIFARRRRRGFY